MRKFDVIVIVDNNRVVLFAKRSLREAKALKALIYCLRTNVRVRIVPNK